MHEYARNTLFDGKAHGCSLTCRAAGSSDGEERRGSLRPAAPAAPAATTTHRGHDGNKKKREEAAGPAAGPSECQEGETQDR